MTINDRGICGTYAPTLKAHDHFDPPAEICTLLAEHPGWHRSDSGMDWTAGAPKVTDDQQPAQGSTVDYCSRWPGELHAMTTHLRGGALTSVRRCSLCGWLDFDDLDQQVSELVAEGRRQATDGWTREWAVDRGRRGIDPYPTETEARRQAALAALPVVTRLAARWEPAGRDGADRDRL